MTPRKALSGPHIMALVALVAIGAIAALIYLAAHVNAESGDKAIRGLSSDNSTPGQITLSWESVTGVHDYRVNWAVDGQDYPSYTEDSGNAYPKSNSYTVSGLDHGATYKFRVRARFGDPPDGALSGDWSSDLTAATAPSADQEDPEPTPTLTPEPTPTLTPEPAATATLTPEPAATATLTPEPTPASAESNAPANLRHTGAFFIQWDPVADAESYSVQAYTDRWIGLVPGRTTSGISLTLLETVAVITTEETVTGLRVRATVNGSNTGWAEMTWQ